MTDPSVIARKLVREIAIIAHEVALIARDCLCMSQDLEDLCIQVDVLNHDKKINFQREFLRCFHRQRKIDVLLQEKVENPTELDQTLEKLAWAKIEVEHLKRRERKLEACFERFGGKQILKRAVKLFDDGLDGFGCDQPLKRARSMP